MYVPFVDLKNQYISIKQEIDQAIQNVLHDAVFVRGEIIKEFESNFANAQQAKHCIAVNNGTAALHLAMMALDFKTPDEIIVPANTFFATPEAVSLTGATPVFVDCEDVYFNIDISKIENAITTKTKAIIAVNLYGQAAQLEAIRQIAEKHNLLLIEDCAQSHLATYKGKTTGTFGIVGCFSFYPGKNLGAYGEGGAVITNDDALAKKMQIMRNHGSEKKYFHDFLGHNYRMESLQAAILNVKLKYLTTWTEVRRRNADLYRKYLNDIPEIVIPNEMPYAVHVYHVFVIRTSKRNELANYLKNKGIETVIHYPIPCHLQKAYDFLNYQAGDFPVAEKLSSEVLSLPMSEQLSEQQIVYVCQNVRDFFKQ